MKIPTVKLTSPGDEKHPIIIFDPRERISTLTDAAGECVIRMKDEQIVVTEQAEIVIALIEQAEDAVEAATNPALAEAMRMMARELISLQARGFPVSALIVTVIDTYFPRLPDNTRKGL